MSKYTWTGALDALSALAGTRFSNEFATSFPGSPLLDRASKLEAVLSELLASRTEVFSVKSFGAKGIGTVDDANAFRATVNAAVAVGGGTILIPSGGIFTLGSDMCSGLNIYDKTPLTFLWGDSEIRIKSRQRTRSHHKHIFQGTRFTLKDESGARVTGSVFPFYSNAVECVPSGGITTTSGSATVTKTTPSDVNWGKLEVGSPLIINGFVPPIGVDKTTINVGGGIDAVTTSITVTSTTGFATASDLAWPQGGRIRIENEIISYTSKDATHFLGCTRGAEGTTAASHADTTRVDRVSYQPFYVTAISGDTLTLDAPMNVTATGLATQIGDFNISFDGMGEFDGNKDPAADDGNNPQGLWLIGVRNAFIGPGLVFRNWDHGGWTLSEAQDCIAYGRGFDIGSFTAGTGVAFWAFGWNKRLTVDALEIVGSITGVAVDDRSISPEVIDGPAEDSTFIVRRATRMGVTAGPGNALVMDGCRNCVGRVERAQFIAGLSGCNGIAFGGATQWVDETTVPCSGNILDMGQGDSPDGTYLAINATATGNGVNTLIVRQRFQVSNVQPLNILQTVPAVAGLTYGATVNINAGRNEFWLLTVTNGTAFTIANPTNLTEGRIVELYIANTSGGAMGAVTFGGQYRLAGAFVAPATANARVYRFRYHRSNNTLVEEFRSPADQLI